MYTVNRRENFIKRRKKLTIELRRKRKEEDGRERKRKLGGLSLNEGGGGQIDKCSKIKNGFADFLDFCKYDIFQHFACFDETNISTISSSYRIFMRFATIHSKILSVKNSRTRDQLKIEKETNKRWISEVHFL